MHVALPEQVIMPRPGRCEACQSEFAGVAGHVKERRHIHDLPPLRWEVTDHHVDVLTCPHCQHHTVGRFPSSVQALAVSCSQYRVLPMERIGKVCEDRLACHFSHGTLANGIQEASRTFEPTMQRLTQWLLARTPDHVDETGARVQGLLHLVPVTSIRRLMLSH